jgi:arylsulfatase A-like enzyme
MKNRIRLARGACVIVSVLFFAGQVTLAAPPAGAAPLKRPNILWIMCDQLRFDCIGANGNEIIHTPNIDRLAAQSANLSRFFVQAPVCVPSRASYFTGRYPHSHHNRVNYTPLSQTEILLPARLKEAGYQTALVGKSHLYYHYPPTSEEAGKTGGFDLVDLHDDGALFSDKYSDYVKWRDANDPLHAISFHRLAKDVKPERHATPPGENPYRAAIDAKYTATAWTGLRTRERIKEMSASDKPFFIFCSFFKPHSPYDVPVPYDSMYNNVNIPLPEPETLESIEKLPLPAQKLILRGKRPEYLTPRTDLEWIYRSYYGNVSQIDSEIGQILDMLNAAGVADNTIIILNADHGDQLLEHGLFGKNIFFEPSIHVPMLIGYPHHIVPGKYDALTECVDVEPTLFEMVGLDEPQSCQGDSFLPLIDGSGRPGHPRDAVFSENVIPEVITGGNKEMLFEFKKGQGVAGIRHPDAKMVRTDRWKYIYYPEGYAELYDLQTDPHERHNLASDPAEQPVVDDMKTRLLQWLCTADEPDQIQPRWLIH